MIRAVLAVVLAAALLAASLPAIDDARRERTGTAVHEEVDRLVDAARRMAATDDPGAGARRVLVVRLPAEGWTAARVDALAFRENGTVAWTVGGRTSERRPPIALRSAGDGALILRGAGPHRLVLSLDGTVAHPVVTVRRFNPQEAARVAHARVTP